MRKCAFCKRPAAFKTRHGKLKSDGDHDLCQRCWRDLVNKTRSHK